MIKKITLLFLITICCFELKADEGMWLPLLVERLNYVDMQKMGCHLTAEEIYSVNRSSIKDAVVLVNNGDCVGSMVSSEGLMLATHHFAYTYIQKHSTVEKDYSTNGFWAMNKFEELRNDKLTVTFLKYMEDVTGKILPYIGDNISETKRKAIVDSLSIIIEKTAIKGTEYNAEILPFFEGNEYYLFVYESFKDVRFVGIPPYSVGEFGAETDNWMWPRHTGDFALFRVYMSPDGKPAEYSKKNIPYTPKHFFPISLKGIKKDDFAMVLGFPLTTSRFITSYGVKVDIENFNPSFIKVREKKLEIMKKFMDADPVVNIQYTSKYLRMVNYYKYFKGQSEQIKKLDVYNKKVAIENAFTTWCNSDPIHKAKYGNVLGELSKIYENIGKYTIPYVYYKDALLKGVELISFANTYEELYNKVKLGTDNEGLNKIVQSLIYDAKLYFKSYDMQTDKKICNAMLKMFYEDVPSTFHPDIYSVIQKKYKGDISAYVEEIYNTSIFASKDKILEFLVKPDYKKLDKDLGYITMSSFFVKYKEVADAYNDAQTELVKGNRLFVNGIMEMNKNTKYYPDANATLRLSYGKVKDYSPNASTKYKYYTTLDELIAKVDTSNPDFQIPDKLLQLYKNKDYGIYATNAEMRVCFITNNDVTGGDSGAPVLNGDGELTGLVFDINWEATSVPILFDENYQRSIQVDIKYVLFIIDKYAGASNIIKELTINN